MKVGSSNSEPQVTPERGRHELEETEISARAHVAIEIARAVRPLHLLAKENDLRLLAYLLEMVDLQAQDDFVKSDDK